MSSMITLRNNGLKCRVVVVDRVWHKGLVYKLECSGINGNLFTLSENYLADRKQRVVLNGKCSEWVPICVLVCRKALS